MPAFRAVSRLVTDIEPSVLAAQREANAMLAAMPHPDVRTPEGLAALRAGTAYNRGGTELTPTTRTIAGPSGDLALRTFTPDGPVRATMLRFHGGGWASGAAEDDDVLNDQIACEAAIAVVSPAYRLAPEATMEQQIAECVAAVQWVAAHAGDQKLLIAGISAGAHLAAATLVALRDSGDPAFGRIVGAVLDCGCYDLGLTPSALAATNDSLVLTRDWIHGLLDLAVSSRPLEQRRVPHLSPALADPAGMPAALFTVGDLDPLRDDTLLMAARWQLAGVDVEADVWPEAAHAFTNMGTPLGALAATRTVAWIVAVLNRHDTP